MVRRTRAAAGRARRRPARLGLDQGPPASGFEPELGEVYVLGVDPAAHGRGLGRLLAVLALAQLRDRGLGLAILYTGPENTAAVHLYRSLGFDVTGTDVQYR